MVVAAVAQEPLCWWARRGPQSRTWCSSSRTRWASRRGLLRVHADALHEPSEIIGPIDINQLRDGRYIRREKGKLPTARLAFLDEIFKSNSAILNILLTIINEKKFYQDGMPTPVRLRVLFARPTSPRAGRTGGPQGSLRSQSGEPAGAGRTL